MLEELQKLIKNKKIDSMLKKHGLYLKHYLPGRVRLSMPNWQAQEEKVLQLLAEIDNDPDVTSVEFTKEIGTILIYFNEKAIDDPNVRSRWQSIIKKYL